MGVIERVYINNFNGGIVNDPRNPREGVCRTCTNFDALTNPYKLTPYYDSESGDSASSTSQKQNFAIALRSGTTYSLYSLGVKQSASTAEVLYKDLTSGSGNDLADASWATPTANQSASGAANFEMFTYYKTQGLIYGARANRYIWAFSPTGTAWADTAYDYGSTFASITEGLVHPKDDIMYFGIDNKVIKNNAGSFSVALTLPSHLKVVSVTDYGNYLAIGCAPVNGIGMSFVYLWDRDATLTTLSESINWGSGQLKFIGKVDGLLVGVSLYGNNSTRVKDRISFRIYDGLTAKEKLVIEGTTSTQLLSAKQEIDGRLFFMMRLSLNGATREGVWSIGRDETGEISLIHERTPNNDTALTTPVLKGFIVVGDFVFQSAVSNSSHVLYKTNDQESYTATSILETTINPKMPSAHRPAKKKLISASLTYESLPASGQVVLLYRVNGASSWTTIFTETTDSAVSTEPFTKAASAQFSDFTDIEFRVQSTGGAKITGITYKYEIITSNL